MSIQLVVDGVTVYQTGTVAPTPPAPPSPAPPPPIYTPPPAVAAGVNTTIDYAAAYVALNGIEVEGKGVYILGLRVAPNDSSAGKTTLPVYVGANSPVTGISQRTVSVSLTPGDFTSATAQIVASGNPDFSVSFTTEPARVRQGVALVEPGRTYYVNVRNDTARAGVVYVLDGQYRNWNQ